MTKKSKVVEVETNPITAIMLCNHITKLTGIVPRPHSDLDECDYQWNVGGEASIALSIEDNCIVIREDSTEKNNPWADWCSYEMDQIRAFAAYFNFTIHCGGDCGDPDIDDLPYFCLSHLLKDSKENGGPVIDIKAILKNPDSIHFPAEGVNLQCKGNSAVLAFTDVSYDVAKCTWISKDGFSYVRPRVFIKTYAGKVYELANSAVEQLIDIGVVKNARL